MFYSEPDHVLSVSRGRYTSLSQPGRDEFREQKKDDPSPEMATGVREGDCRRPGSSASMSSDQSPPVPRRGSFGDNVRQRKSYFERSVNSNKLNVRSRYPLESSRDIDFVSNTSAVRSALSTTKCLAKSTNDISKDLDGEFTDTSSVSDKPGKSVKEHQKSYIESLLYKHRKTKPTNGQTGYSKDNVARSTGVMKPVTKHVEFYDDTVVSSHAEVFNDYGRRTHGGGTRKTRVSGCEHSDRYDSAQSFGDSSDEESLSPRGRRGISNIGRGSERSQASCSSIISGSGQPCRGTVVRAEVHQPQLPVESGPGAAGGARKALTASTASVARWAENNQQYGEIQGHRLLPDKPRMPILKPRPRHEDVNSISSTTHSHSSKHETTEVDKLSCNISFDSHSKWSNVDCPDIIFSNQVLPDFTDSDDMFATINNVSAFVMKTGTGKGLDMSEFKPDPSTNDNVKQWIALNPDIPAIPDIELDQSSSGTSGQDSRFAHVPRGDPRDARHPAGTDWGGVMQDLFYNLDNVDLKTGTTWH